MKIVVGLGNPGKKYDGTRHNIGFEVLESIAGRLSVGGRKLKFGGELAETTFGEERLLLVWPHTFMNLSGECVALAARFYKAEPSNVLVVCDDFHLPVSRIRIRGGGSAGGQKGLANILRHFGTEEVPRLRLGVGPLPDRWNAADFVLTKFKKSEREAIDAMVDRAVDAALRWIESGLQPAMNEFNRELSD